MPDIRLAGTPQDYSSTSGWPTISYTANAGNNRVVVAVVGYESLTPVSNPQLNILMGSVPFTQIAHGMGITTGQGAAVILYIKESNIPAGAQSITFVSNSPGSAGGGHLVTLYTLENVDQTTPIAYSLAKNTAVSTSAIRTLIPSPAGGFAITAGCSGNIGISPASASDATWTERRDAVSGASDFGFHIYDKAYPANKTETLAITCGASALITIAAVVFNPFVSNKVRFDTSANGYSFTIESGTSSTIDVNVPTNVSPGDMMLGVLTGYTTDSLTITPPSGWNVIFDNHSIASGFLSHLWVGYKIANTAEPSSYQWSGLSSTTGDDQAWIFRITGHDKNNPIDAIGSERSTLNATQQNINPFNTTKNDSTVVYILSTRNGSAGFAKANGTFVSPVGSTQVVHQKTRVFSTAAVASVAYENKQFAGNTGTKFFTAFDTNGAYFTTIGFAIKQAPYSTVQAERLIETGKVKQFSDNFNRANTAIGELGPNWDVILGPLRIINNQYDAGVGTVNGSAGISYAKISENIVDFSDDHSAQITITALGTNDPIGPAARVTNNGCYAVRCDGVSGSRGIHYINGTTSTFIGTVNILPVIGDTLKITAQGSTITAYKNGVQVDQVSNTAYTTGQPGIFYNRANLNVSKGDDFYAEDLNSPTSGTMVKMYDDGTIRAGYFSEKEYLDRIKYHYDGDVWAGKFIEIE